MISGRVDSWDRGSPLSLFEVGMTSLKLGQDSGCTGHRDTKLSLNTNVGDLHVINNHSETLGADSSHSNLGQVLVEASSLHKVTIAIRGHDQLVADIGPLAPSIHHEGIGSADAHNLLDSLADQLLILLIELWKMAVVASWGESSRNSKDNDLLALEGICAQDLRDSAGILELRIIWAELEVDSGECIADLDLRICAEHATTNILDKLHC